MSKDKDPLQILSQLADALARVEKMRRLLTDIWLWQGPYGPHHSLNVDDMVKIQNQMMADKALRLYIESQQMPAELQRQIRDFFEFDDSE